MSEAESPARNVLVIEDDPNVRGLLQTLLASEGYSVETASDGIAGLVKASSKRACERVCWLVSAVTKMHGNVARTRRTIRSVSRPVRSGIFTSSKIQWTGVTVRIAIAS